MPFDGSNDIRHPIDPIAMESIERAVESIEKPAERLPVERFRFAQIKRLAHELISGVGDQRITIRQIFEKRVFVDRTELQATVAR
jgi:hypothetical protein